MEKNQKQTENQEIPLSFNRTLPDIKITFSMKVKNAIKMIKDQGFEAFAYKISRILIHKKQDFVRKIFYPNAGKNFREEAKQYFLSGQNIPTLSIVVTVMGQYELTILCLSKIIENKIGKLEIVIMDGKGDFEIKDGDLKKDDNVNIKIIRDKELYPAFKFWMEQTTGDIMLFIHNDIIIEDKGFDITLRYLFLKYPQVGVAGFVGSDEIDEKGSKNWGTTSNFQGKTYTFMNKTWSGKKALVVGRQKYDGISASAVIDGCSMALRRAGWNKIKEPKTMPMPYYDYDRIVCLKYIEVGYKIATLGIACDHISNVTGGNEIKWHENVRNIGQKNNIETIKDSSGKTNWDMSLHRESKRLFLKEWRDEKKMIPRKADWKI